MKLSQVLFSKGKWKEKAVFRRTEMSYLRKAVKRHKKQIDKDKHKIQSLKYDISQLRSMLEHGNLPAESKPLIQYRTLCILIVIHGIVSFRSVPRILRIFQPLLWEKVKIPHFTSVINWSLRVGISCLQQVADINHPWVAIIDCSIDVGIRKALVVLRLNLDALRHKKEAIGPSDCECIGVEVSTKWNGQLVSEALTRVFEKSGIPLAIIKDGGADLNKGVELFSASLSNQQIFTIDDVGHFAANALKALFETSNPFINFLEIVKKVAIKIRQTDLAWLSPPKIRSKARFMSITELADWAQKVIEIISNNKTKNDSLLTKTKEAFADFLKIKSFLNNFCSTCFIIKQFLTLLKTFGLNEKTYLSAKNILEKLPTDCLTRIRLVNWLEKHILIQRTLNIAQIPLPVSSDPIESLFGAFKTIIQRHPKAELNKLINFIPLLCRNLSNSDIDDALKNCSHSKMLKIIEENIPDTIRQDRIQNFKKYCSMGQKSGQILCLETG